MQPEYTELGTVPGDDAVIQYLTMNPEFFVVNQDILPRLRIPHATGNAVSLIEKQVTVLRAKCTTLENSLRDLISVARENEQLHQRLHVLIQDIISATTLNQIVSLVHTSLCENFNADDVRMLVVGMKPARAATRKAPSRVSAQSATSKTEAKTKTKVKPTSPGDRAKADASIKGCTLLAHNDERLELFSELFDRGETVCGLPSAAHLECLVGRDQANIASAAIIPLYHERKLGLVMLTSRDESRFASGKGVMFLDQLGQMLSRRLHTYGVVAPSRAKRVVPASKS